jgi:glycosyltransferase involved in cell wall biosynthesis
MLPGYRSTRKNASAIIIGSRATWQQMPERYHEKCVYIPENAVDPTRFTKCVNRDVSLPLKLVFVGRLVPYKGADMLIEAAAPLMRQGKVKLDLVGEGPMRPQLEEQCRKLGVTEHVAMDGWVEHTHLQDRLLQSDVFAFPSIREFGGAVVLEAMAVGLIPIVVDYGGPGELVTKETGFAVEMGRPELLVSRVRQSLESLVNQPHRIVEMRDKARRRALERFTWDSKARQVQEVYRWVLGQRLDKPNWGMPLPDEYSSTPVPSKDTSLEICV